MQTQNWTTEFKNAFRDLQSLYAFLAFDSSGLEEVASLYPVFLPKALAQKIKNQGPDGVLAREFLPLKSELAESGLADPIGDKNYLKAPQLIHRYPSRALFAPTTVCPVHCRYCFRKNELNQPDEIFKPEFEQTLDYLRAHSEISEIIFTGGDPFTLTNERLQFFINAFAAIPSIKDIRFHTRYPVILPERIEDGLLAVLSSATKKFRTVSVAVHANHASEFDDVAKVAIHKLAGSGIQLLSQTVLLKNVNDRTEDLLELFNLFIELKVRPYYLHHPDRVKGGMHFYLDLNSGRKLYHSLRKELPGWGIPQYILDLPGGDGKIPAFNPETHHFSGQLITLQGTTVLVEEPEIPT